jgi:EXS family
MDRFVWVSSLVPEAFTFFGPSLSIWFGSLEILRRAMWGMFRVEHEHVKFARKKAIGFCNHDIARIGDVSLQAVEVFHAEVTRDSSSKRDAAVTAKSSEKTAVLPKRRISRGNSLRDLSKNIMAKFLDHHDNPLNPRFSLQRFANARTILGEHIA